MSKKFFVIILAAFCISCAQQQLGPELIPVTSVSLNSHELSLSVGQSQAVVASVFPEDASNKNIQWQNSDESVVEVSQDGIITAKAEGISIITALTEDGGFKDRCAVTVSARVIHVTGVEIIPGSWSMCPDEQKQLAVSVTPSNATDNSVVWQSSNTSVATVVNGLVSAICAGKATITATTNDGGFSSSCNIVVSEATKAITGTVTHISCISAHVSGKAEIKGENKADTKFGVLYSKSSGVLYGSAKELIATDFDKDNNFELLVPSLSPSSQYYYRTYIYREGTIYYGEIKTFTTKQGSDVIQTVAATNIVKNDATLNARLDLSDYPYSSIETGFYAGKSEEGLENKILSSSSENGTFSRDLTIDYSGKHYFQAYVILDSLEYRGNIMSYETDWIQVATKAATEVKVQSATMNGSFKIESRSSFSYELCFYYSDTERTKDGLLSKGLKISSGGESYVGYDAGGDFAHSTSILKSNTQYYYIAAVEVNGVTYCGEIQSFNSESINVAVYTADADNVKSISAELRGYITGLPQESLAHSFAFYYSETEKSPSGLLEKGIKVEASAINSNGDSFGVKIGKLKDNTKYYYIAACNILEQTIVSESIMNFSTTCLPEGYVNLGLSVAWGTCNIGASYPWQIGEYFAWADKNGQTWDGSKWSGEGFNHYNSPVGLDSDHNLTSSFDAAYVRLGQKYRIPTCSQLRELQQNTTATFVKNYEGSGISGVLYTSTVEGFTDKSIFLPLSGFGSGNELLNASISGSYWSRSYNPSTTSAYYLDFGATANVVLCDQCINQGRQIRAVTE